VRPARRIDAGRAWPLAALAVVLLAASQTPADVPGSPPFALIAPTTADALPGARTTTAAQQTIRAADRAAARVPDAVPRVHVEGTLPHQGIYDDSEVAERDWPAMRDLGLAYALTGDDAYARAAARYFQAWLAVYRVSLDPIDETNLDGMILGYDLVGARLPDATRGQMTALLRALAVGYLGVHPDPQHLNTFNNWQSHRVKLITLAAFALGDPELIADAARAFQTQLDWNLRADGAPVDFGQRDALHYVTYDLEPLLTAALAARAHGLDWYTTAGRSGASLAAALRWLEPYARGDETHEEFVHTTIAFDKTRAAVGVPGFAGVWQPSTAATTYQLAARLAVEWAALTAQLGPPPDWLALCFPL